MPYMANDNQNQVLDEQTEVIDDQKSAVKRVRKTKPKASEGGTTASLFGIAPYQPKKMKNICLKDSLSISAKF
jgi:DnaK suppressor protein